MKQVKFAPCEQVKYVELELQVGGDGQLLIVPVCLRDVSYGRDIMVGVFVYKDNHLYAKAIKRCTAKGRNYCCECHTLYAGDFEFLFEALCLETVTVEVIAHSIYC
ncbi:MAG: hypothetical protein ACRCTE_09550 [Cellulosilyticaceae bacterium]